MLERTPKKLIYIALVFLIFLSIPCQAQSNPAGSSRTGPLFHAGRILAIPTGSMFPACSGLIRKAFSEEKTLQASKTAKKLLSCLEEYNIYIKDHAKNFEYNWETHTDTFAGAKKKVEAGETVGITCVVPLRWAFIDIGIRDADDSTFYIKHGRFIHFNGQLPEYLEKIEEGGPVGKTVKEAVDQGLLAPGDIVAWEDAYHTFIYSGEGYDMYEGSMYDTFSFGSLYETDGIRLDYVNSPYGSLVRNIRIGAILRFKK